MATTTLIPVPASEIAPSLAAGGEVTGEASPSITSLSLRSLVEELDALIETVECVQPEDEKDFLKRFQETHLATKAKIDRTGDFLDFIDSQIAGAKLKAATLSKREHRWAAIKARLEGYLKVTIMARDQVLKGKTLKYPPLEGETVTFSVRKNPDSLAPIPDESIVPAEYKDATVTVPLVLWESLLDAIPMDTCAELLDAIKKPGVTVRRGEVKSAIVKGTKVEGCALNPTSYGLVTT
jgi:hypothetical protein